jgi:hypothetical protein
VSKPKVITRITRYGEDDIDCGSDYYEIIIKSGPKTLATFGDYYHDKGWEKSEGFIQGLRVCYPELKVVEREVADYPL